jgi:uncharacterized protein YjcR
VVGEDVVARARSPKRDKAFEMWKESEGEILLKEIASKLGLKDSQIRKWKNQDKWDDQMKGNVTKSNSNVTNKRGAPKGNQNAVGNNGGAPKQNQNSIKHGLFAKYLPKETLQIVYQMDGITPVDLIWMNIELQFAQIVRAQQIMFVENKDDTTKELKRHKDMDKGWEKEWEIQFAWDKHASFLTAVSRAISTLNGLIKQFDDMAHTNDERRLKLEQMKLGVEKSKVELGNLRGDTEGDAHQQASSYVEALNAQAEDVFADEVVEDEEA